MISIELKTISIFSTDLSLDFTINQISKALNKSYAFTNKFIRNLLDENILNKKIVGSAILCSLNFANEKTLGLLMLNSIERKNQFLQKSDKNKHKIIQVLKNAPNIKTIFFSDNKFKIITDDKQKLKSFLKASKIEKSVNFQLIDSNEFKLAISSLNMRNTIILEGYEIFWKLVAQMK